MAISDSRILFIDLGGVVLNNHSARARDFVAVWRDMASHSSLPDKTLKRIRAVSDDELGAAIWGCKPVVAAEKIVRARFTPDEIRSSYVLSHLDGLIEHYYKALRQSKAHTPGSLQEEAPFPGVKDVLGDLSASGYRLLAISRKDAPVLQKALDHHGLGMYFDGIVSTGHDEKSENDLDKAREKYGVTKDQVLLIGDTEQDMAVCQQNGIRHIMARWGHITALQTTVPKADHMDELHALVTAEFERPLPAPVPRSQTAKTPARTV